MIRNPAVLLALCLMGLNLFAVVWLFTVKSREKRAYRRSLEVVKAVFPCFESGDYSRLEAFEPEEILNALERISARFEIPPAAREAAARRIESLFRRYALMLGSPYRDHRLLAAYILRFFRADAAARALARRIPQERSRAVLLRAADTAVYLGASELIPPLLDSLPGKPDFFVSRLAATLAPQGGALEALFSRRSLESREEKLFFIYAARQRPCSVFGEYLKALVASSSGASVQPSTEMELARLAARALADSRPSVLDSRLCLAHPDPEIRRTAIRSLGGRDSPDTVERLFGFLADPLSRASAAAALRALTLARPQYLKLVLHRFYQEEKAEVRNALADVLHERLDYFLYGIRSSREPAVLRLVSTLLESGRCYGIASFLNRNHDPRVEDALLPTVQVMLELNPSLAGPLATSLKAHVRERLGLSAPPLPERNRRPTAKSSDRPLLLAVFLAAVVLPIAALFAWEFLAPGASFLKALATFLSDFSKGFAFYALSINAFSLALLWFSVRELSFQIRAKKSRPSSMVFREGMLPTISVIVPAFREEKTIVQSVRALLDLKYPDYEVIVVNDGSPDGTLDVLTGEFALERTEPRGMPEIGTAEILGWYRSPANPRLWVIDKVNGGKADALNAGINAARGDYICGIDADSILEQEALLRAAVLALDGEDEFVAAGGNILPANGCEVHEGDVARIRIPRSPIALFQTVEYLRAFLAGRLGWARLKGMLIISGAFGLFSRRRVVEAGGYMTRQGPLKRDTVGEDMELVVRLVRSMREKGLPYDVSYAFDANCWTEVPEDASSLHRQRDRWQRGLLEILSYHRRMILNPRYGRIGLGSILYYLVFETLGPFYELMGYAVSILSMALGLLDPRVVLLLFSGAVLSGILVSTSSLAVAERQVLYFSVPETWKLIGYAVLENFGFRQWTGLIRVAAYVGYLSGKGGWGSQKRKGFLPTASPPAASPRAAPPPPSSPKAI